jgi:hypothetical protein
MCEGLPVLGTRLFDPKTHWTGEIDRSAQQEIEALIVRPKARDTVLGVWKVANGEGIWVKTGTECGALCGNGYFFRLEHLTKRWKIVCFAIWNS